MPQKVLIIDDDKSFCKAMKYNLEQDGFTVSLAHDGKTGVIHALSEQPDLVVLDMKMPEMPGSAVISTLRHDDVQMNIPFLAISADADKEYIADQFNCDGFLAKPFEYEDFVHKVNQIIKANKPADEEGSETAAKKKEEELPKKPLMKLDLSVLEEIKERGNRVVVIIENDEERLKKTAELFEKEKCEVIAIPSGKEAVIELSERMPDLTLIKMNLPDLSGDKVIEQIQHSIKATKSNVIIFVDEKEKDSTRLRVFAQIVINIYGNDATVRVVKSNDPEQLFNEGIKLIGKES